MGRLSGLKDGEAITADVRDDRAEAGEVLAVAGPDEDEMVPAVDVRPPPDCKMLKPGKAGEMEEEEEEDVVEIGKSVAAVAGAAPRVAVRSSGEIDGWWPAELLLNVLNKAGLLRTVGSGAGGGGSGNGTELTVLVAIVTLVDDGRLTAVVVVLF